MESKNLGLVLDFPEKGKLVILPGYVEDLDPSYLENLEEVDQDITEYIFNADLINNPHKVYKKKKTKKI